MKTTKLLILTCALSLNTFFAQENNIKDSKQTAKKSYLELPRIEVVPIKDTQADRQYELYIKLPEEYAKNKDKNYPVIYFTDALWHVEILSGSAEYIMEEAILVGISWQKDLKNDMAFASRFRDYSMIESSNEKRQARLQYGEASNHLSFIRDDVIKYVENKYRTDPDNRTYFGYSMGGKFGAYILFVQPDTFKNYIFGSPSTLMDNSFIYEHESITALKRKDLNANVFVSIGSMEKEGMVEQAKGLISILKGQNYTTLSSKLEIIESADHGSAFPVAAVRSMQWLSQLSNFPVQGDPYFGQKPPGLIPEIFAPGIISINGRYEHAISFSPDLDEVYFSANKKDKDPSIYFSKLEDKKWTNPKKANFTKGKKVGEMHPFVNPTGDKIYFTAHDEFTLPHHKESIKIWYVDRLENSWSNAKRLDSPINDDFVFYSNQAKNGDLFYTNISKFKMYYAPIKNGKFPEVHEVGVEFGLHGFISPSQDYLVVNARNKEDDKRKDNDIYVYFKEQDGTWSKPINLGNEVNSSFGETAPSITPDGKYLFFGRYNEEGGESNFYWVSTEVIHKVRPAGL